MRKTINTIIVCILLVLCGCNGCEKNDLDDNNKNSVNIVLCDLTLSISSKSIDSIARHAGLLYRCSHENNEWIFYGIDGTDYNCPLGEFNTKMASIARPGKIARRDSILNNNANTISANIRRAYKDISQSTCITKALKTVYDKVNEKRRLGDSSEFNLIILSDLVEDCRDSPFGELRFIDHKNYLGSLKRIDTSHVSPFDLKALGVNIYIVPESKNTKKDGQGEVSRSEIEDAWRKIFNKYGYGSKDDRALTFTPLNSLPERFAAR